jgi:MFS transporter, DHA1 family, multidrug resistance protein
MDSLDREVIAAERDASVHRYRSRESHEIERVVTASSISTSSSDQDGSRYRRMSLVPTQTDLERHPTELSRIATQRSQHSATVGRTLKSRDSRRPLPAFGAGKPYPPPLPSQEQYVVEFDGPDDPMHAQNWPLKRKYVVFMHCRGEAQLATSSQKKKKMKTKKRRERHNLGPCN